MDLSTVIPFSDIPQPSFKTDSIAIKNDYVKFLYASMLLEFSESEVRQFWDKHSYPYAGDPPDLSVLYGWLWQEDAFSSLDYMIRVADSLETFLLSRGLSTPVFIRNATSKLNKGLLIPAKTMFKWSSPFLELFFSTDDLRYLILQLVPYYTSILIPGIHHGLIQHTSDEKTGKAVATIMLSQALEYLQNRSEGDITPLPPFDCELWAAVFIQTMPLCMRLKPYEKLFILADLRPVHSIVPNADYLNGSHFIDGKKYGIEKKFNEICQEKKLADDLTGMNIPNLTVTEIIDDYFCPERKRIVLHKGCVYGAPVCLYRFEYLKATKKPKEFLSEIIDESVEKTNSSWLRVKARHDLLLKNIEPEIHCTYHIRDESISVNGKHLMKSVPAKILRYIITQYLNAGKTEFEYREFINNSEIILNTLSPNMAVRINRLSQVLETNFPFVKIIRTERGKFTVTVSCMLSYSEDRI